MKFDPPNLRAREQVFYWQRYPSKIKQGRKTRKLLEVEIIAAKGPMAVVNTSATEFQVNTSKLRRPLDIVDLEELPDSRERARAPVQWQSWEGLIDVWEMFSDNSYLSAYHDRKDFATNELRTKKAESFSPQLIQASGKSSWNFKRLLWCPRRLRRRASKKVWQQDHLCIDVAEHQILGERHFSFWGQNQEILGGWERCNILNQKYHHQRPLLRGGKPMRVIHNLGNLLRPLEPIPASRERVVPTERQVRTILGDCTSRAKLIPAQAPQYRQHTLVSDFLDLANLSIQEEVALATNWIKGRPEDLKLQELWPPRRADLQAVYQKILLQTSTTHLTTSKLRAQGDTWSFTWFLRQVQRIFPRMWQSFDVNFLPNVHFQCCVFLQGTLGPFFDIFAASGESTALVAPVATAWGFVL